MKKLLIIPILLMLVACGSSSTNSEYYDMKDYTEMKSNESKFKKDNPSDIVDKLEKKEEGIYYIGFSDCPWCQSLVPVLNDVLITNSKFAYYLDVRDTKFTEDEKVINKYDKFDKDLGDKSSNGAVPFLIVINGDGEIKTHVGTLEGHDATTTPLTDEQTEELKKILTDMIK